MVQIMIWSAADYIMTQKTRLTEGVKLRDGYIEWRNLYCKIYPLEWQKHNLSITTLPYDITTKSHFSNRHVRDVHTTLMTTANFWYTYATLNAPAVEHVLLTGSMHKPHFSHASHKHHPFEFACLWTFSIQPKLAIIEQMWWECILPGFHIKTDANVNLIQNGSTSVNEAESMFNYPCYQTPILMWISVSNMDCGM